MVKTEKADMDDATMIPLCTYGRDEKYIENKLWLMGASTVILRGVGDGMIPLVCLKLRIPCLLIYDAPPSGEEHQKIIENFLVEKVKTLMEEATPAINRFYRTKEWLNCRSQDDDKKAAAALAKKKKDAALKKQKEEAQKKKQNEAPPPTPKRSPTKDI